MTTPASSPSSNPTATVPRFLIVAPPEERLDARRESRAQLFRHRRTPVLEPDRLGRRTQPDPRDADHAARARLLLQLAHAPAPHEPQRRDQRAHPLHRPVAQPRRHAGLARRSHPVDARKRPDVLHPRPRAIPLAAARRAARVADRRGTPVVLEVLSEVARRRSRAAPVRADAPRPARLLRRGTRIGARPPTVRRDARRERARTHRQVRPHQRRTRGALCPEAVRRQSCAARTGDDLCTPTARSSKS